MINSAQTPHSVASRVELRSYKSTFQGEFQMATETRQQSAARQTFGYFGAIAMILIVVVALCWGFSHI